ncbi:expressed conserved [Brachionus plicatilis]|uniref:Expressed conserved n=1 Tax=Brachionus plicatilis TaxID=10195 RepID=A0A3M7QD30_BRAPC|nr:expressed conserved [Brachionus plicatilis]
MNQIPRQIETRVIFLRIGDINTVKERFFAEILVESRWEEPKLVFEFKKTELKEKEITNYKKYWNPNIYVENVLDDSNQTVHYQAKKKRNLNIKFPNGQDENQTEAKYWIYEYKKIKGFFFQKLMLKYFPLDVQDLSIVLTTYKSSNEVLLVQNKENLSIIGSSLTIDKNIWFD